MLTFNLVKASADPMHRVAVRQLVLEAYTQTLRRCKFISVILLLLVQARVRSAHLWEDRALNTNNDPVGPPSADQPVRGAISSGASLDGASLTAGQALNAGWDELQKQVMATQLAAATEQAEYQEIQIGFKPMLKSVEPSAFTLLNDQPVTDVGGDELNTWRIADGLAQLLSSRNLSPFVLALDAEWGMGKSSVLGQMYQILDQAVHKKVLDGRDHSRWKLAKFNAWTADNSDALQDVVATVLRQIDPRTARKWVRRLAQSRGVLTFLYACATAAAGFFGFSGAVSNFLTLLSFRGRSRNEVRVNVGKILRDWRKRNGDSSVLVVFVDDLDRCPPKTAIQVCEAIKLYLDIPGLIFVLGWNLSALRRSAAAAAEDKSVARVLEYFEKIVQLTYSLPLPDRRQIEHLIDSYAEASGTSSFLDAPARQTLADQTQRNPRRIKQIINGFIVESALSPKWAENPDLLIRAELIYQLYPRLYWLLIDDSDHRDLISDLIDYYDLRERASDADSAWWSDADELLGSYHVRMTPTTKKDPVEAIERLGKQFPEPLAELASDDKLAKLLKGIGDKAASAKFSAMLKETPLAAAGRLASEVAASSVAQAAQHKMQTNTRIFQGFDEVISG